MKQCLSIGFAEGSRSNYFIILGKPESRVIHTQTGGRLSTFQANGLTQGMCLVLTPMRARKYEHYGERTVNRLQAMRTRPCFRHFFSWFFVLFIVFAFTHPDACLADQSSTRDTSQVE